MSYVRLPSGVLASAASARAYIGSRYFWGNRGAYRSAGPDNKNTKDWHPTDGSADADSMPDLPTLRRQSRDLARNETLALGALRKCVTQVVGTSLVPQSRIDANFLGLSEEQSAEWQMQAERVFRVWASNKCAHSERRLSFWALQSMVYRSVLESGDVFVVRRYMERQGAVLGLSCQVVEADRVKNPEQKPDSDRLRAGVEFDREGSPVAYHIADVHPGEDSLTEPKVRKVPAWDGQGRPLVLSLMQSQRPGQTRGVPYLAPVIEPLKQLGRYSEAEVSAAVLSAFFAIFTTSPLPGGDPLEGFGAAVATGVEFDGGSGAGGIPRPPEKKLESGLITHLAPGEDIRSATAQRPNSSFDPFIQAVLRQIGMALGLPYEVLIGHYTSSYSAARAAIIDAWCFFSQERAFLIESFCVPVYEWVISEAIARGVLEAPGFFDDLLVRDAWLRAEWVGAGMPQIDPLKEAKAATEWNKLGVLSLQEITTQQGRDWDATRSQIQQERATVQAPAVASDVEEIDDDDDSDESRNT